MPNYAVCLRDYFFQGFLWDLQRVWENPGIELHYFDLRAIGRRQNVWFICEPLYHYWNQITINMMSNIF